MTVILILQNFLVWLLLHRAHGSIPLRIERLYVVILRFDLQKLIEVQDGFVCVADLEIFIDHPCDFPSREKARLSFGATSSCLKTLLVKSPLMIFFKPLAILESTTSKFVCNYVPVTECDVFRSAEDFVGFNVVDPYTCFKRTTCTPGHVTPDIHSADPGFSEIRPDLSFSAVAGKLRLSLHLFWLLHSIMRTFCGCPYISRTCSTVRTVEMDRQAVSRCNKRTRSLSLKVVPSAPSPPQPVTADPG